MADKPKPLASIKTVDKPHAPHIFFDEAPVLNAYNGIIGITLTAGIQLPAGNGEILSEQVAVAYLRGNPQAFAALRKAIDDAFLLAAKPQGQAN